MLLMPKYKHNPSEEEALFGSISLKAVHYIHRKFHQAIVYKTLIYLGDNQSLSCSRQTI